MDNTITGLIGIGLFLAFIGGLAHSIGATPFIFIVIIIGAMAIYDFYESVRDARKADAAKLAANAAPTSES